MFQVRFLDSGNEEREVAFGNFDSVVMRGITLLGITDDQEEPVMIGELCADDTSASFWLDANGEGWSSFIIEDAVDEDEDDAEQEPEDRFFFVTFIDLGTTKNTLYKGPSLMEWVTTHGYCITFWAEISEEEYLTASQG